MIALDSSFIIGFHKERDAHHQTARALMDRFLTGEWGRSLLLEDVVIEVSTVLLSVATSQSPRASGDYCSMQANSISCRALTSFQTSVTDLPVRQMRMSFADAAIAHIALERAGGLVLTFDEEFSRLPGIRIPSEIVQ